MAVSPEAVQTSPSWISSPEGDHPLLVTSIVLIHEDTCLLPSSDVLLERPLPALFAEERPEIPDPHSTVDEMFVSDEVQGTVREQSERFVLQHDRK